MVQRALTSSPKAKTLAEQETDFTAEGAPPPGKAMLTVPAVAPAAPAADVAIEDWEDLLNAIKSRLRLTVDGPLQQQFNGTAVHVQASVLECVAALEQLQATLAHSLTRLRRANDSAARPGPSRRRR
jgi:uncharacterized protein YukE